MEERLGLVSKNYQHSTDGYKCKRNFERDFKRAAEKLRMWMSRTLEQMNVSSRKE